MRAITDLKDYTRILPYDSEVFGVYQPLLGWQSKRIKDRVASGFRRDVSRALTSISHRLVSGVDFDISGDRIMEGAKVRPAGFSTEPRAGADSFVFEHVASMLPPLEGYKPEIWDEILDRDRVESVLKDEVVPRCLKWPSESSNLRTTLDVSELNQLRADQLNRESLASGYLLYLKDNERFAELKNLFYPRDSRFEALGSLIKFNDPFEALDPFKDIDRVGLSPIGIVHLYRQYFFEFDTFLGTPVSHVWLSPGSTVELVEINTRKTIVERTIETELETTIKTEKSTTEEDELSSAVKEDNKSDTKFGMNATVNQGWVGGSATATSSIDMGTTQSKARETTHKHMRQQTDKLSTEIRKNYKSTFRTVTETTDTSSKRYVLANTSTKLINYELRRKMRQVGVQVQDVGTYLSWQTYVDDPSRQLGISRLVHIAKDPEVGLVPPPEATPVPEAVESEFEIDIPFVQSSPDMGDLDEAYRNGFEVDTDFNEGSVETIRAWFDGYTAICPQSNYVFSDAHFDYRGNDVQISLTGPDTSVPGKFSFAINLDYVNFRGNSPIRVALKIKWLPSNALLGDIAAKNQAKVDKFNEETKREFEKAFVAAAAERIKLASNIEPRPFHDLREEERIVVYRSLIQDMLTKGISMPDDRTRHVVSELLNSIFDVDKMLYFVAPEWWRPRLHESHQGLGAPAAGAGGAAGGGTAGAAAGGAGVVGGGIGGVVGGTVGGLQVTATVGETGMAPPKAPTPPSHFTLFADAHASVSSYEASGLKTPEDKQVPASSTVTWGGVGEGRADNYYITGDSTPAHMGSSLGWLLQLDGDNLRNAFLNAPWVKAVIPIRPGQERAAINWLSRLHVEGTDGLGDDYVAPPAQLAKIPHNGPNVTIRDAIDHLCDVVAAKHVDELKVAAYPPEEINDDNKVLATPLDKVYEHGFYPLQGGFKLTPDKPFEVFDQWIEILPTDQVVPVEVTYDPKTGRQL